MKIIVDAFGGDNAPLSVIAGARQAVDEQGVEILLVGDEERIKSCAAENGISLSGMEILHTAAVITMHDEPGEIIKSKKDSSMAVALSALAAGEGDAFVSAGSTGAIVVGATFIVKRIKGVKRAALCTYLPTATGHYLLTDVGANADCRAEMLAQFAVMASVYLEKACGVRNPTVGLVNIGTEETKGGALQLEAYDLLKKAPVHFIGNVEARDLNSGVCDIAVADGFTGNVVLKLTEGVAATLMGMIKGVFKRNFAGKLAAMMVMPGLKELKKAMDYTEVGGAPLMGIAKPVIKAHGSSDATAIKNAIRQAAAYAAGGVIEKISAELVALGKEPASNPAE
ncbi:MAG: phosphate acyltransferase PlsX [Candidatus Howiella sp.]|jgi:glycerol-3-phosphate acyltransferase PlsX